MKNSARLADFILSDMETIVADWEAFARSLLPASSGMDTLTLRDHAEQILRAIAADLSTAQSSQQQADKSKGLAPPLNASETAAQTHAVLRGRSGFDIKQLVAEYRALRASVLRHWSAQFPSSDDTDFDDVIRFNEAIDQALTESVDFFSFQVDQSRNLMLGMLGHDMRSPLQAIQMTAKLLSALNAGEKVSQAADRLITSGARMHALVNDLADFNRLQLGVGMRINIAPVDLAAIVEQQVEDPASSVPGATTSIAKQRRHVWCLGRRTPATTAKKPPPECDCPWISRCAGRGRADGKPVGGLCADHQSRLSHQFSTSCSNFSAAKPRRDVCGRLRHEQQPCIGPVSRIRRRKDVDADRKLTHLKR